MRFCLIAGKQKRRPGSPGRRFADRVANLLVEGSAQADVPGGVAAQLWVTVPVTVAPGATVKLPSTTTERPLVSKEWIT